MKRTVTFFAAPAIILALAGCASSPANVEKGPHGTIAYFVKIEASEPGARIEANNDYVGLTPCTLKIFGDKDGTFHNFGSYHYIIRALPLSTNQYIQTKDFRTGGWFTPEDMIPSHIYFYMNQKTGRFSAE